MSTFNIKPIFVLTLILCYTVSCAKKVTEPFVGHIQYKIVPADTAYADLIPETTMELYTNDTIVRIETRNAIFGKQVSIKHLELKKSYLLLTFNNEKYAIQTSQKEDTIVHDFTFEKVKGRSKDMFNEKTKKCKAIYKEDQSEREIIYFEGIRPDLLDVYPGVEGLPARYSLNTKDGPVIYEVVQLKRTPLSKDLFGIPTDYKKLSLDEFLSIAMPKEN